MFQAVIMFCILGQVADTCRTVYPEPILPRSTCEGAVAVTVDYLRQTAPPESVHVWAHGYCKPVNRAG